MGYTLSIMKTQLLTVSPAVARAQPQETPADIVGSSQIRSERSDKSLSPTTPRPLAGNPDWHYQPSEPPSLAPLVCGVLLSGGLHAYALWGFNDEPVVENDVADATEFVIEFMEMPPVDELDEPEEVYDGNEQQEEIEPGQYVPMQADVPSIATDATFVQKMDLQSLLPRPDFDSAKVVSIPPRIARNAMNPTKMKDLFNLSDLDRQPTPLLQQPPTFPHQYKNTVRYAEVVVDFIVDSRGRVPWAKVYSSTHYGFEDAAILGVSRWQFKPGTKHGRAVNTRMRVPVRFRVED
ncbi:MAG: hypothetical protein SynsKO_18540 [Synoicihabitans sp.]